MNRVLGLFAAFLMLSTPAWAEAERYEFDKTHTSIVFYINHLGFSDMAGQFKKYDGFFTFDEKKPEVSKVSVSLDPSSIRTTSEVLDEHLQGKDYFDTETFPAIKFESNLVRVTGKNTADISGDLTLRGVTKPATLHVKFNKAGFHPITQDYIAGFSADTTIKRSDFGMTALTPMVGDVVRLHIEVEGVNQARKQSAKKAS